MSRVRRSVDELIQGWPIGLAELALMLASHANDVTDFLRLLGDPKQSKKFVRQVPVRKWLRMYRSRRRVCSAVGPAFGVDCDPSKFISEGNRIERSSVEEITAELGSLGEEALREMVTEGIAFHREWYSGMIDDLQGTPQDDGIDIDRVIGSPEGQFVLRVTMPVWIAYKTMPGQLMRRARGGDIDALCDLLRVDKAAICDPGVAQVVHDASTRGSTGVLKRIGSAMTLRSLPRISRRKVKRSLAGLLSAVAKRCGHELTEPKIRAVFDVVASAGGALRDRDLPIASEALAKAIQRERRGWPIPDKSRR